MRYEQFYNESIGIGLVSALVTQFVALEKPEGRSRTKTGHCEQRNH